MKYEMITKKMCKVFRNREYEIWATQEYLPEHNMGHWKYMIYCRDGDDNILKIQSSGGCPPQYKIDEKFLKKELKNFWREYKQYQTYVNKAKQ
jgi:hypothetical protein